MSVDRFIFLQAVVQRRVGGLPRTRPGERLRPKGPPRTRRGSRLWPKARRARFAGITRGRGLLRLVSRNRLQPQIRRSHLRQIYACKRFSRLIPPRARRNPRSEKTLCTIFAYNRHFVTNGCDGLTLASDSDIGKSCSEALATSPRCVGGAQAASGALRMTARRPRPAWGVRVGHISLFAESNHDRH